MRKARWLAGVALLALLASGGPALASDGPEMVRRGRELYEQARFSQAHEELRAAIARLDLSPAQRAQAWTYLGFCFLALGHPEMAAESLVSARAADPTYTPDLNQLSPKARELWLLSDPGRPAGAPATAPPSQPVAQATPVAPAPGPLVAPPAIRETPLSEPMPRLHSLELAYDVREGKPVGATRVFAPQTKAIHLWAALENLLPGTPLRAVWTYLGQPSVQITDTEMPAPAGAGWVEFSCRLAPGRNWPSGRYQVEVFIDQDSAGVVEFQVP